MLFGRRQITRRNPARRARSVTPLDARRAAALRAAIGPGFQTGATERIVQQATRP